MQLIKQLWRKINQGRKTDQGHVSDSQTVSAPFMGLFVLACCFAMPVPADLSQVCLLYTSPSPRDRTRSRMPSSA